MFKSKTDTPAPAVNYRELHASLEQQYAELSDEIDRDRRHLNDIGLAAVSPNATAQQIEALAEGQSNLKEKRQKLEELRPLVEAARDKAHEADAEEARKHERLKWAAFDKLSRRYVSAGSKMDKALDQLVAAWEELSSASKEAIDIAPRTKFAGDGTGTRVNIDMQPHFLIATIERRLRYEGIFPGERWANQHGSTSCGEVVANVRTRILAAAGVNDQPSE